MRYHPERSEKRIGRSLPGRNSRMEDGYRGSSSATGAGREHIRDLDWKPPRAAGIPQIGVDVKVDGLRNIQYPSVPSETRAAICKARPSTSIGSETKGKEALNGQRNTLAIEVA